MANTSKEELGEDRDSKPTTSADTQPKLSVGGWTESEKKPRWKPFPGPGGSSEPLRVTMTRQAYAELTAHAKESLSAEICGVLVGDVFEDDDGRYVAVEGTIRGTTVRKSSTHVTFTQETWNQIHKEKDRRHAKRQIVGWYHSHPGFGVEFSEMDLFIQRNFFSGTGQIAFVSDPLGGQEAILVNVGGKTSPVSRFWVDGREKQCHSAATAVARSSHESLSNPAVDTALKSLENRISQLMQLVDSHTASLHRYLLTMGMFIAIVFCGYIGYTVWRAYTTENRPPELQSFVPVPVQLGDKSVLLGVGIVKWEVPPSLNAAFIQLERERQAAAAAAASTQPSATSKPAAAPTTGPSK